MQRLGDAVDLPAVLERLMDNHAAYRAERVARFGWDAGVRCATCGDTGRDPDRPRTFCLACEYGRERAEVAEREARWQRMVPSRVGDFRLDTAPDREAADHIRAWLDREPWRTGENFLLTGSPGTGKTGLAYGALHVAHMAGIGTYVINVAEWIGLMRPTQDDDRKAEQELVMRRARRATVLLMDDLGTEKDSEWTRERIYAVVNERYDDRKPTIVTSNLSTGEMRAVYGDRIVDRLVEVADGKAMRGANLRARRTGR